MKTLLSDPCVDPAADDLAIGYASVNGHVEVVKVLLADSRVKPAAHRNIAICMASCHGHFEVVKVLLADSRVDPAEAYNWAIRGALAFGCGHVEVVQVLMADSRVDPARANVKDASVAAVVAGHGMFVARHASSAWNAVSASVVG